MLAAMRRVPITLYYTTWCPACTKARAWLAANQLSVTAYDLADASAKASRRALTDEKGIPLFHIEGQIIVGFGERRIWNLLSDTARRQLATR